MAANKLNACAWHPGPSRPVADLRLGRNKSGLIHSFSYIVSMELCGSDTDSPGSGDGGRLAPSEKESVLEVGEAAEQAQREDSLSGDSAALQVPEHVASEASEQQAMLKSPTGTPLLVPEDGEATASESG